MWKVIDATLKQNIVQLELEQDGESYRFTFASQGRTVVAVRHRDKNGKSRYTLVNNAENVTILKGGVFSHKGLRLQEAGDLPEHVIKYLTNYGEYL